MSTILVSIASYKDSELLPTIKDCISKAKNPERIYFGICEQDEISNNELESIPNLKNLFVYYKDSKGQGWHRNQIYKHLYEGQDYCLMIDSHSRFAEDWDEKYINALNSRPDKTILTGFPPHYGIGESYNHYAKARPHNTYNYPLEIDSCYKISGKGTGFNGEYTETVCVSAANIFSTGEFTQETLYDEYLHPFAEQEIISCLAYQHNYKVEVMKQALVWHCYYNNLPGSKEKYRMLPFEEIKIQGYETCFVPLLDKRKSLRSATEWTQHILKFKQ